MTNTTTGLVMLDDQALCSAQHLIDSSGLLSVELDALIDCGVIAPANPATQPQAFYLHSIVTATTARRLRDDFELDLHGLLLALTLLQRLGETEAALSEVRAQLGQQSTSG